MDGAFPQAQQNGFGAPEVTTISRVLAKQLVESAPTLLDEAARIKQKKRVVKRPAASQHVREQLSPGDRGYCFLRFANYDGPAPNSYAPQRTTRRISPRFNTADRPDFERALTSSYDRELDVPPSRYLPVLPRAAHAPALTPCERFPVREPADNTTAALELREKFGSPLSHKINASDARRTRSVTRVERDMGPGTYCIRSPFSGRRW